eukprot:CAMPEP_0177196142 /NCGR_PEP_ID=MMETSP0367-20130122/23887_1 /TAXON_ID=447022 ORGANISM="Scrippsiella hangoei-like, Strain SHHI-4" /NCGR_SAMPLE_ID=MMETSP0367 /ASSEMBLY_ACC=CAM_ASM_000362 /LENGTH=577 /DNA_ID=CAMNT_0018644213 /DNA_START=97 /DNA_END=1830 /DNA_ORIENTATION=-
MQLFNSLFLIVLALAALCIPASGKGGAGLRSARLTDASSFQGSLGDAMGEALGCGGQVDEKHLASIEKALLPMWNTLPKTTAGRVERRSLRYLVHRHFNRQSALHIRGFEPSRPMNGSDWGDSDILSQKVPAFVESVLQSKHKLEHGFALRDAALMVATLEQLIFESESAVLERIYHEQHKPADRSLSTQGLGQVLESYMIHWMMGADQDGIRILLSNRTLLETAFPHWKSLQEFVHGEVSSLEFKRQHAPVVSLSDASTRKGHNALTSRYSFDDAHSVVGGITRSFASFWESECTSMKHALVEMDTHNTGRVPMAKFYNSALETDWRFGESESYLRELGALDESSTWTGKQVLIANYIQATSNCIVSAPHYSVCCVNDCEAHLAEIEEAIGAPTARPSDLLALVGNMSSHMLLDDATPNLKGSLTQQLEEIAAAHGGLVPLRGRLFAQWLHYVFPRECPFPHKAGTAVAMSPIEFGEGYIATSEDMKKHALEANTTNISVAVDKDELEWMSQWSPEEELIADHTGRGLRAPWESSVTHIAWVGGALMLAAGLFGSTGRSKKATDGLLPVYGKSHFV